MKYPLPLIAFYLFISHTANSQTHFCSFDELHHTARNETSFSEKREAEMSWNVYQSIINHSLWKTVSGTFIIPVVFHIMHNNGPENVADSIIYNCVNELNLRFQNAVPFFDSTGHAINIQFCLATVDPRGNPTTGITRDVTPLTNLSLSTDDADLKNISRWAPPVYCNVYVVNSINGTPAAYASYPLYAGSGTDGVVVEAAYLTNYSVLTHEMGHYCGLLHTFSFSCSNFNCLLDGDQVCDTPPDTSQFGQPCRWNSCPTDADDTTGLSPFQSDVNELPNYMDYTSCPLSFSAGQGTRMETVVSLYRSSFLNSNACGSNPGQPAPIAGFNFIVSPCNNGNVMFSDSTSQHSLFSEWDFNNDGIYEYARHNFTYTFPTSGTYTVTQKVTGYGGEDSITYTLSVMKGSTANYPVVYPQLAMDTLLVCRGEIISFSGDTNALSYEWSTGETTRSISFTADSAVDILLTMTDVHGIIWSSQCRPIHVEVYPVTVPQFSGNDSVGNICQSELLTFNISNPITGQYTWHVYNALTGWFDTADHHLTYAYYPDPNGPNQFVVTYTNQAGCNNQSDTININCHPLPFIAGVQLNVFGNTLSYNSTNYQYQWYGDNVALPGAVSYFYTVTNSGCYYLTSWDSLYPSCITSSDTACIIITGINELSDSITIKPNPVKDILVIHMAGQEVVNCRYQIITIFGNEVISGIDENGKNTFYVNCSSLANGIYILRIVSANMEFEKKIVLEK